MIWIINTKAIDMCDNDNTVFMRSDFPENNHTESEERVLSALLEEGVLHRLSPGLYVKPVVMDGVKHNETTV